MRGICVFSARFILMFMKRRAAVAYSNLSHCFPYMSESEIRNIAFESCSRMVEMALFVVASPYMPLENLKGRVKVGERVLDYLRSHAENPRPIVLMIPHFCMMETITMFPVLVNLPVPKVGVLYRPFDSPSLESWVKSSRQRFGIELLSRKDGLSAVLKFLHSNGVVAVLYDQNSGYSGALSLFFGRFCLTSELPGIIAERANVEVAVFYARRTGFWRSEVDGEILPSRTVEEVTFDGNMWLENRLKTDAVARYDWLWLHHRWNAFTSPQSILNARRAKSRDIVEYSLRRMGVDSVPRFGRIYVNAPESFSEVLAFLPMVNLLRKSRYDCTVTLLCPGAFGAAVDMFGVADGVMYAPPESASKSEKRAFYKIVARRYPDIYLSLRDSEFDDAASSVVNVQFSIAVSHGRRRRNFYHTVDVSPLASAPAEKRQEFFLRSLGLEGIPDYSPLSLPGFAPPPDDGVPEIALVLDGAASLDWGSEKWRRLVEILYSRADGVKFAIFGGPENDVTAFEISAADCDADMLSYVGRLDAVEFARRVSSSSALVGCDCDFTRISNALGIPTALICGGDGSPGGVLLFDAPKCAIPVSGADSADVDAAAERILEMLFSKERKVAHDKNRNPV